MLCRNHIDVSEAVRRCARCGTPYCQNCLVDIGGMPYCGTCKSEEILDIRSGVQSGVLDLASIGRRVGAEFVDGFVLMIPLVLIMVGVTLADPTKGSFANFGFILVTAVAVIYKALMLSARGQTLGKMAMKVKVVNADGSPLSSGQAWGREIARAVLGFLYI